MKSKTFFSFIYALILIISTVLLISEPVQAQVGVKQYSYGTVANNSNRIPSDSIYVDLDKVKKELGIAEVDSIAIVLNGSGELDVDTLDVYFGSRWQTQSGVLRENWPTVVTFTVTLNLADGVTGRENVLVSGASITKAHLKNYSALKFLTRGATAGNDATDSYQDLTLELIFYGTKE